MASFSLSRMFAPALLAAGLGLAALTAPSQARADDDLVRVIVGIADVVYHGGQPYYRHGHYGPHDRLVVVRDRYHRPTYYRYAPRVVHYAPRVVYHAPPRHAPAHGYYKKPRHHGHYVSRYDDRRYRDHDRYDRYDRRDDRRDDRHDRWDDDRHDRRGRGRD